MAGTGTLSDTQQNGAPAGVLPQSDLRQHTVYAEIAELAACYCDMPAMLFLPAESGWQALASASGWDDGLDRQRCLAFCEHALPRGAMEVSDLARDPLFDSDPWAVIEPRLRFYACLPFYAGSGRSGFLCLADIRPGKLSDAQKTALRRLCDLLVAMLRAYCADDGAAQMAAIIDSSFSEIFLVNADTCRIVYANDGACTALGYGSGGLQGMDTLDVSADYNSQLFQRPGFIGGAGVGGYHVLGTAHIRSDGRTYPVEVWLQAGLHKDDSLWRSVLSGLRLKNEGEARLLRIQHFYEVFAKINYAIIHSRDTAELFQSICDTAVTLKMCDVAWIGMLKQREVMPVASAGMSLQRVRSIRYDLDDPILQQHSVAIRAVLDGAPCLTNAYADYASDAGWIASMRLANIKSAGAFPLYCQGQVAGVFAIGDAHAGYFDTENTELLAEMASAISFFVDKEVQEQAKLAAETAIRETESRYRTLVDLSPDSIYIYQSGFLRFINRAGRRLFGTADTDTMQSYPYQQLFHPEDWPLMQRRTARAEQGLRNPAVVVRGRRMNGRYFDMEVSSSPFDYQGATAEMCVVRDVTLQRKSEELILGQARILESATRGEPLEEVLQQLTYLMERQSENMAATVMLLAEDGQRLYYAAGAGMPEGFRHAVNGQKIGPAAGSCGTAAFRRETVVVTDIASDVLWRDYKKLALGYGFKACWSMPIFVSDGALVGTIANYYKDSRPPTEAEVSTTANLNGVAAVAIERDRNYRKMVEIQNQLLEAQKLAGLGDWSIDCTSRLMKTSAAVCEMLGIDPPVVSLGVDEFMKLVHPADKGRVAAARRVLFDDDQVESIIDYKLLRKDGSLRYVEERSIMHRDAEGAPLRYTGVLQDITGRKTAEQALILNKRALESTSDGVLICDAVAPDMPIISVNQAFEKVTGYMSHEVVGRNCRFLQGRDTEQIGLVELRAALRGKAEGRAILRNYRKDGTPFWNSLKISPVRDTDGAVTHFVGTLTDISERVNYEHELAFQASHDSLTGLPNRNLLEDRMAQAISFAKRDKRLIGLAFVDVDHFKSINDTMGHNIGDRLLKAVAERFVCSLRAGDTVSRFGGDEFVVICPDIHVVGEMQEVISRMFCNLRAPLLIDGQEISVDASIGVAIYPHDGETVNDLLKSADMAMYKAKASGRGNYQFYVSEMGVKVSQRRDTETELRQALERNEFRLHYQPKVSTRTGDICGMEALVRWQHPERGMVPPLEFIHVAEESNLIIPIGEWVTREACRQNQAWHSQGLSNFPISVNASMVQFRHQGFCEMVESALLESGLPAAMLELEITESLATESPEMFITALKRIKDIGVRISIDDFGTGYSSLSYIKRFPIDALKIDRSFVRDITVDPDDAAICRTIINMAHNLKLHVVAEGVETEAQANYLRRHQCDELQGYLLCRPEPAEQITERLTLRPRLLNMPAAPEESSRTLLLVDDEENILRILARLLKPDGYCILLARTASRALEILAENEVAVILTDQRMPEMSGTEFLRLAKDIHPESVRMVLSGHADFDSIAEAINRGAIYKFMVKPWDDEMLIASVREAFRHHELLVENRRLRLGMGTTLPCRRGET
ncbi:EAL domain-containing protein [Undibacterium sp. TJN25]|uniref:EAL domain-containing protein n=1 Tax=Undibacterium sp. TJN25 TaxID=3413056 RepID=UPI003BF15770